MHFPRHSTYESGGRVPVIVRVEGSYLWDDTGKSYFDGLSGLFVVQAGHGRTELVEAAARQAGSLAYFPLWSYTHPETIHLAERLAHLAPGDLNRVFFTTGGGEAVETAWTPRDTKTSGGGDTGPAEIRERSECGIGLDGTSC